MTIGGLHPAVATTHGLLEGPSITTEVTTADLAEGWRKPAQVDDRTR